MLGEGDVIERAKGSEMQHHRVLWLHDRHVVLFNLIVPNALPQWVPEQDVLDELNDGSSRIALDIYRPRPTSILSDAEVRQRDARMEILQPLIDNPMRLVLFRETRWREIERRAQEVRSSPKQVIFLLRLWWTYRFLRNGLAPVFCDRGGRGKDRTPGAAKLGRPRNQHPGLVNPIGRNVDNKVLAHFKSGFRFYKNNHSLRESYDHIIKIWYSDRIEIDGAFELVPQNDAPSLDQFRYWLHKLVPKSEILRARLGDEAYERNHAPRPGNAAQIAFGPGSYYQIDATVADVNIVSQKFLDCSIGRPIVYIVVDVFSGMIVGFSVCLSVSRDGISAAIENALADKVEYCATLGLEIRRMDWPSRHKPGNLVGDRGSELIGEYIGECGRLLNIKVCNCPRLRPDLKGWVEFGFSILGKETRLLPGAVVPLKRGARRPKGLPPVLTLPAFTKWVATMIMRFNNTPVTRRHRNGFPYQSGQMPTPAELWTWGCETHGVPPTLPPDTVRLDLMFRGEGRETDKGLRFSGLHYLPRDGITGDAFVRRHRRKWQTYQVLFDRRDVSSIYVVDGHDRRMPRQYVLAPCDHEFFGFTADEVKADREIRTVAKRADEKKRQLRQFEHDNVVEKILADEIAKAATKSGTSRIVPSMRALRTAEKRALDAQSARTAVRQLNPVPSSASNDVVSSSVPSDPCEANQYPPKASVFGEEFDKIMKEDRK